MAEVCFFILHNHPSLSSLYAIISWPYKPLRCHFKSVGLSEQQTRLKLKGDLLFEYKVQAVKHLVTIRTLFMQCLVWCLVQQVSHKNSSQCWKKPGQDIVQSSDFLT